MFREGNKRAVSYLEVVHELLTAYDAELGLETGHSGVAMSDREDPTKGSLYDAWFKIYLDERVFKTTGLDFDAFLNRPRYKIDIMLRRIREENAREGKLAEAALEDAKEGLV